MPESVVRSIAWPGFRMASVMGICLQLAGCTNVQPWERGNLAKSHMAIQPFPIQAAFREHMYGARESATGGSVSSGGGGCGCY